MFVHCRAQSIKSHTSVEQKHKGKPSSLSLLRGLLPAAGRISSTPPSVPEVVNTERPSTAFLDSLPLSPMPAPALGGKQWPPCRNCREPSEPAHPQVGATIQALEEKLPLPLWPEVPCTFSSLALPWILATKGPSLIKIMLSSGFWISSLGHTYALGSKVRDWMKGLTTPPSRILVN